MHLLNFFIMFVNSTEMILMTYNFVCNTQFVSRIYSISSEHRKVKEKKLMIDNKIKKIRKPRKNT